MIKGRMNERPKVEDEAQILCTASHSKKKSSCDDSPASISKRFQFYIILIQEVGGKLCDRIQGRYEPYYSKNTKK